MKRIAFFLAIILVIGLVSCAAPATPTPVPTPEDTVAPTVTPAPSPVPEEDEAYPAPPTPAAPPETEPEAYPEPDDDVVETPDVAWSADGVISEGEYANQTTIGPITVYWSHDGEYLYLAAEAENDGWLSVGVNPERMMQGADFYFATYDGEPDIKDAYGQAPTGPTHPPDTELGGSFDIVEWAVVYEDGWMRFEAQKPLDTGDEYDAVLVPGETYPIIAAMGASHDFNARHVFRGSGEMTLD